MTVKRQMRAELPPRSPDDLDHALRLVPRGAWLAWAGLLVLLAGGLLWGGFGSVRLESSGRGVLLSEGVLRTLAPIQGEVVQRLPGGARFSAGDTLVTLRDAAGQTRVVTAHAEGIVVETYVEPGMSVPSGAPLANLEPSGSSLHASVFVPATDAGRIRPGQPVEIDIASIPAASGSGLLLGHVVSISPFPASPTRLMALLENRSLAAELTGGEPVYEATIALDRSTAASGQAAGSDPPLAEVAYRWSGSKPPALRPASGMLVEAAIVLGTERPLSFVLPGL